MFRGLIFLIFFGFLLNGHAQTPEISSNPVPPTLRKFLNDYFKTGEFDVFEKGKSVKGSKFYLAVRYVDSKGSREHIFDKGIGIEIKNDEIAPLLYFENNMILGRYKKVLVDLRTSKRKYYGWLFRSFPNDFYRHSFSMNIAWYMDENHLQTAEDPPIFVKWDKKKLEFVEEHFDAD